MRIFFFTALAFISLLAINGCYYDNEEELYAHVIEDCDTTAISFSADVMPIIMGNCATPGCHIAGGSGNGFFENYENIKAKVDNMSFRIRTIDVRDMPPGGNNLSDCAISIIEMWLDAGAPNN